MVSIGDLPDELLLGTCFFLAQARGGDARKDFWCLCLTSKRFRAVAECFLYQTYFFSYHRGPPALRFAANLVRRPELATHVRKIVARDYDMKDSCLQELGYSAQTREGLLREMRQRAETFRFPAHRVNPWKADLSAAMDNASLALILFLTPKIEELDLAVSEYGSRGIVRRSWLMELMESALDSPAVVRWHGFSNLRKFQFSYLGDRGGFALEPLAPLFRLPGLREFEARKCFDLNLGIYPSRFDQIVGSCPLESLTFLESQLGNEALRVILRTCKGLRHFRMNMRCLEFIQAVDEFPLDYDVLDQSLQTQSESLETLDITFADATSEQVWAYDPGIVSSLHSLANFPNLKHLNVPINAILNFDKFMSPNPEISSQAHLGNLLPSAIESFSLCNKIYRHHGRFRQLKEFVDTDISSFPKLRHIGVCSSDPRNADWRRLGIQLRGSGVTLHVSA